MNDNNDKEDKDAETGQVVLFIIGCGVVLFAIVCGIITLCLWVLIRAFQ